MVKDRYRGDRDQANRLYAARKHAGFASGRAAAVKFGFSEPMLRAHETAEIPLSPKQIAQYARAFAVSSEWLKSGRGDGPEVDDARAARLKIRSREVARREDFL